MKKILFIAGAISVSLLTAAQKTTTIADNLSVYNDVLRMLDINYVDTLDYNSLLTNSIDYMLHKIDPYTVYIPKSETDDLRFMTTGSYGGIGSVITQRNDGVYISDPYEGMPAQKAGLRAGDKILEVDHKSAKNKTTAEVSDMLRGVPESHITIKVERKGEKKPLVFEFIREKIQINPVSYYEIVAPHTGYILFTEFTENSAIEFKKALEAMNKQQQLTSLIIDLRGNGGGLINEAVQIVGYFVPKGTTIVSTKGRKQSSNYEYKTTLEPLFPDMRLAVLVNSSSASASEIVAGSIQDLDRGILIGQRTFGKGLVQSVKPIVNDGHLKVTTAKYYIPSGRCIQAIDYSHKNPDGSVGRVPDSLTHEFKTAKGRIVKDGGGVSPDIEIKEDDRINICYYLLKDQLFFDYANEYVQAHKTIASPKEFALTDDDIADFERFITEQSFTYQTETSKALKEVLELAKVEGVDSIAKAEFEALDAKLNPSVHDAIEASKDDVKAFLGAEIVKRYYYAKGSTQYLMPNDKELHCAIREMTKE